MEDPPSVFPASLPPEQDEGDTEYKLHLCVDEPSKLERRATQLRFRITEGGGECFYYLGVTDDGAVVGISEEAFAESLVNLHKMAAMVGCVVLELSVTTVPKSDGGKAGHFLIRLAPTEAGYVSVSIGVVGNVDAGKSTTIGTLTRGQADDGRGRARLHVFTHKHEITTGRTSSVGHQILGFDSSGEVVNSKYDRPPPWTDIVEQSSKIISFFDLAGHERYLKTTIHGLTTIAPDYAICMVGANMGVSTMTREHMTLLVTLRCPFFILVSKVDIVPPNVLKETLDAIANIVKKGAGKTPFSVRTMQDVLDAARHLKSDTIVPVLQISNVTSVNMDLLRALLNVLPPRIDYSAHANDPAELLVDKTYSVTGHPTIIAGLLRRGTVTVGDTLALGPYHDGSYKLVKVKSIHNKTRDVRSVRAGHYICLSLKGIVRSEVKKGMVVVADRAEMRVATREFWAFIAIHHSPTTIKSGYQPFVHVAQVRQSVEILEILKFVDGRPPTAGAAGGGGRGVGGTELLDGESGTCLRTGDRAHIRLRFLSKPEYIRPQMFLFFREGKVKAAGKVLAKAVSAH